MGVQRLLSKKGHSGDYPYYRRTWLKVVLALLIVALVPLMVIGGGVSSYTFAKLETHTLDALRVQVRAHQHAIDDFLSEREIQLKLAAALHSMEELITPGRLETVFEAMRRQMPGFVDLGVIDMQGRHRAFVGPQELLARKYDQEAWFAALRERESYISDVYPGFRQVPHFIMAVRQGQGDDAYILRATVDSDYFDALVASGPVNLNAETFIINRDGLFQTRSQTAGHLLTPSGIHPEPAANGIQLISREAELMLTLWQQKVPWLTVVQVKRSDIYGGLNRARTAVVITFILGAVLITATVLLTTGNLVGLLEAKGQSIRLLDKQLRRTSYLASSMELSIGFFAELRDILANIDASIQWLAGPHAFDDAVELKETIGQISREASRGHALFDKFMTFVRPEDPIVSDVDINELLEDLLAFLEKEMARRMIRVERDYQAPLAPLRSDRGKLRQVFQNLILNAMAALAEGGQIHLVTRSDEGRIVVAVKDDGPGIADADRERIFEPLFTTRPQGTGLGLPICRAILEQLGGSIAVDSRPGQRTVFTVSLPDRINAPSSAPGPKSERKD